jgi:Ner family transcriptional regulator
VHDCDWHPEDVKAAIRKTGLTMTALSLSHGLAENAVRMTLRRPWPRVEAIIAAHLGLRPSDIWPSRYSPNVTHGGHDTPAARGPHRQRRRAA